MKPLLLIAVACMAVVVAFGAAPAKSIPIPSGWSNFLHLPAFFGLTLLWYIVFCRLGFSRWVSVLTASAFTLLFGLALELHQTSVPGRYPSRVDLGLNVLGVGLAVAIAPFAHTLPAYWNKTNRRRNTL